MSDPARNLPLDLPDEPLPPFRHWVGGDYEDSEGLEFLDRPAMNWRSIVCGLAVTGLFVAAFVGFAVMTG